MNRLTKEQSQWLIEEIDKLPITCPGGFADGFNDCEINVKKIINQCTEKEFPKFTAGTVHDGLIEVTQLHEEDFIDICVHFKGVNGAIVCNKLDFDEFKAFTLGCQRIVEWIDQNE